MGRGCEERWRVGTQMCGTMARENARRGVAWRGVTKPWGQSLGKQNPGHRGQQSPRGGAAPINEARIRFENGEGQRARGGLCGGRGRRWRGIAQDPGTRSTKTLGGRAGGNRTPGTEGSETLGRRSGG